MNFESILEKSPCLKRQNANMARFEDSFWVSFEAYKKSTRILSSKSEHRKNAVACTKVSLIQLGSSHGIFLDLPLSGWGWEPYVCEMLKSENQY